MFDLKVTINGKPLTETNFKNELENSILEAAIETVTEQIMSALTSEEAKQITLNFQGDLNNFSVNISGDDDIVEKAVEALGDDKKHRSCWQRRTQQINGREGETATFLSMSFVKYKVDFWRFRPTSSQSLCRP